MNSITQIITLIFSILFSVSLIAQEETGMPGDHFSLEGALDLFKKASSIEEYEELLNKEDNAVNNLDLNQDGDIDFIKVIAHTQEDVHTITLQAPISQKESQDIAVIAIEKTGSEQATLQIIGDEEIYGEEVIIEPYDLEASSSGNGPSVDFTFARVVVNVWFWPSVRHIYRPIYRPYVSPYYWGYYPRWWRSWRPVSWAVYSPRVRVWNVGFRVTPTIRVTRARNVYVPRRTTSVTVVNNYRANKVNYVTKRKVSKTTRTTTVNGANGSITRTNTKVTGTNGNRKAGASRTTTTVNGTNGNRTASVSRTNTRAAATNGKNKVAASKTVNKAKVKNNKGAIKKTKVKKTKVKKKKKG